MDLCLTGRMMDAVEAERAGLVARVVPADKLLDEALTAAATIASYSLPVIMMIKESINRSFESGLNEGLLFERRSFHASFALDDQKEGMAAFVEKRKAEFKNQSARGSAGKTRGLRPPFPFPARKPGCAAGKLTCPACRSSCKARQLDCLCCR